MSIAPKLAEGQSFVAGRSIALAKELIEKAVAAGLDGSVVSTASHGYIVPTSILDAGEYEDADANVAEAEEEVDADADEADADADDEVELFDPSAVTVAEVKEYLDGADDAEWERVLAAELDGKNRSGVLSYTSEESK